MRSTSQTQEEVERLQAIEDLNAAYIERLRTAGDAILAAFSNLTVSGDLTTVMKARNAFNAWEEARRG